MTEATELIYLYAYAITEPEGPTIHLFVSDPWDGDDGQIVGRYVEGWWESVEPRTLDDTDLDTALTEAGCTRITAWTRRTGRSGRVIASADLTTTTVPTL